MQQDALRDIRMMSRCIALAEAAAMAGELPFACIVSRGAEIISERMNDVVGAGDVTRHAELIAVSDAQKKLGRTRLRDCALYTIVEPCVMCSFPIRECGIRRVVYSIASPFMGGDTRWDVLTDKTLARRMPVFFRRPPEVVGGVLALEAADVWRRWRPLLWALIKQRQIFTTPAHPHKAADKAPRFVRRAKQGASVAELDP
jgi:tRNA(adenine34) deaminase